jgi:HPt (histidine-containing phosphotransfer) domain-containing protein
MLGDNALDSLPELIRMYLRSAHELMGVMTQALAAGDAAALRQAAHSVKGSSGIYGATALAALCQEVEDAARVSTLEGLDEKLAQITAELARVEAALWHAVRLAD